MRLSSTKWWRGTSLTRRPSPPTFGKDEMMKKSEYQLVLEFHGDSQDEFEQVFAIEKKLDGALTTGEVDGNDVGQGIVNIFIITEDPQRCFEEAMQNIGQTKPQPEAAGFRNLDKDEYQRVWPLGDLSPFELK
jgi:hypothetical protein